MARNINNRLIELAKRRKGVDRLNRVAMDSQIDLLAKSALQEAWQKRATSQANTQYALGAMQEVGPDYTRISVETAERVGNQLKTGLESEGISAEFRLQGSVPLNVHIRGVSDVDLLTLDKGLFTYATYGSRAQAGGYSGVPATRTSLQVLLGLRTESEKILKLRFPAVTVDTSGGKAIGMSGGSLARPVDVVPSHWYDGLEYQNTRVESDRGVTILDKKIPTTIDNWPFRHIKLIEDKCDSTYGGLRKAIRLCKNVKADAIEEGSTIAIPSFDLAALMYHADQSALLIGYLYELRILAEAQRFLDYIYHHPEYAQSLRVPDGSRLIFDKADKYEGAKKLSMEMDDLLRQVAREQAPLLAPEASLADCRAAIESLTMPS